MRVVADYKVRGGLHTVATREYRARKKKKK